jgi:hypothetical protein
MTEFDEKKFEHLVGHAWYDSYKYHFRHHPNRDEIVRQLVQEDLDQETVDLYFKQAESQTAYYNIGQMIKNGDLVFDW